MKIKRKNVRQKWTMREVGKNAVRKRRGESQGHHKAELTVLEVETD